MYVNFRLSVTKGEWSLARLSAPSTRCKRSVPLRSRIRCNDDDDDDDDVCVCVCVFLLQRFFTEIY